MPEGVGVPLFFRLPAGEAVGRRGCRPAESVIAVTGGGGNG